MTDLVSNAIYEAISCKHKPVYAGCNKSDFHRHFILFKKQIKAVTVDVDALGKSVDKLAEVIKSGCNGKVNKVIASKFKLLSIARDRKNESNRLLAQLANKFDRDSKSTRCLFSETAEANVTACQLVDTIEQHLKILSQKCIPKLMSHAKSLGSRFINFLKSQLDNSEITDEFYIANPVKDNKMWFGRFASCAKLMKANGDTQDLYFIVLQSVDNPKEVKGRIIGEPAETYLTASPHPLTDLSKYTKRYQISSEADMKKAFSNLLEDFGLTL